MYKLFIIPLFVISIGTAQIYKGNITYPDRADKDSLVDVFPLEIGNQWVYNYNWTYYGLNGFIPSRSIDTGTVTMKIINKNIKIDTTLWFVQETFDLYHQDSTSAFSGPINSIDTIEIVELTQSHHQLYNLSYNYKSIFPFYRGSDTAVYRYTTIDSEGMRTFGANFQLESFVYSFKQGIGLISVTILDRCTCMNSFYGNYILRSQIITDVSYSQRELLSHNYQLFQNYPNPFNPITTISFYVPSRSFISLKIFDCLGREVGILVYDELSAGNYSRQWNAANMPSGVYFYRLQSGSLLETKKFILLK